MQLRSMHSGQFDLFEEKSVLGTGTMYFAQSAGQNCESWAGVLGGPAQHRPPRLQHWLGDLNPNRCIIKAIEVNISHTKNIYL